MNAREALDALLEMNTDRLVAKQDHAFKMASRHNPYPRMAGKHLRRFRKWSNAGMKAQDQMMRSLGTRAGHLEQ